MFLIFIRISIHIKTPIQLQNGKSLFVVPGYFAQSQLLKAALCNHLNCVLTQSNLQYSSYLQIVLFLCFHHRAWMLPVIQANTISYWDVNNVLWSWSRLTKYTQVNDNSCTVCLAKLTFWINDCKGNKRLQKISVRDSECFLYLHQNTNKADRRFSDLSMIPFSESLVISEENRVDGRPKQRNKHLSAGCILSTTWWVWLVIV